MSLAAARHRPHVSRQASFITPPAGLQWDALAVLDKGAVQIQCFGPELVGCIAAGKLHLHSKA